MNIILSQKVIGREIFETPSLLLAASAPHVGVRVVRGDTFLSLIHDESRRSCLNLISRSLELMSWRQISNRCLAHSQSPDFKFRFVFFCLQMLRLSALCGQIWQKF